VQVTDRPPPGDGIHPNRDIVRGGWRTGRRRARATACSGDCTRKRSFTSAPRRPVGPNQLERCRTGKFATPVIEQDPVGPPIIAIGDRRTRPRLRRKSKSPLH